MSMDSDDSGSPIVDEVSPVAETSLKGSHPKKKNKGKVPKRIHKAEREKMKREHLNELFFSLANAIEVTEQNNGKASILNEAARIVKDMLAQIECLKRENAALLSESQYVTVEKKELQEENSALQDQIGRLHNILEERRAQSKLVLNITPSEPEPPSNFLEDGLRLEPALRQAPVANPVFVIPVCSDLQVFPEPGSTELVSKSFSNVSKPHARYPTEADSWPSQLLEKQSESRNAFQINGSNTS